MLVLNRITTKVRKSRRAFRNKRLYSTFSDLSPGELSILFTPFDLKRLESYANNMLDYHVILDLMPAVANLYFQKRLESGKGVNGEGQDIQLRLTAVQSSILLALGLQRKTIDDLEVSVNGYPRSYRIDHIFYRSRQSFNSPYRKIWHFWQKSSARSASD